MFLDDRLYEHLKKNEDDLLNNANVLPVFSEKVNKITNELFEICSEEIRTKVYPYMSHKEAKALIDRVFNSWNSFTRRLGKEHHFLYDILVKYSFKTAFFKNDVINQFYNSLK